MGFQKKVELYNAPAVAGDMATPDQAIYQAINFVAEEDINVGTFCFPGTDPGRQAKQGGAEPIGFVQRVINYVNYDVENEGTLTVKEGNTLTVAVRGDFYAVVKTTPATVGQKVYVNTTDGTIKTAAASQSVPGHVETNWVVKTAGLANELIVISNWA